MPPSARKVTQEARVLFDVGAAEDKRNINAKTDVNQLALSHKGRGDSTSRRETDAGSNMNRDIALQEPRRVIDERLIA